MLTYYVLREDGKALLKDAENGVRWTSFEERAEAFVSARVAYNFAGRFRDLQDARVVSCESPRLIGIVRRCDAAANF